MSPITNLELLLKHMEPLLGSDCAFCKVTTEQLKDFSILPIAMFQEQEGVTVIYKVKDAEQLGLSIDWIGTQITLNVNSSLDAVGFLARITNALAEHAISVNAFSPIFHDHLFVRPSDAEKAMQILKSLSKD
jgi:hypothetical protein